jgi:hypothetical protein
MKFSMRPLLVIALTSAFVLQFGSFARAQEEEEDADQAGRNVRLDAGTIARLGIQTTKIQMAQNRTETTGFGVVIAFDTLAQVDSDLTTAEVAAENSAAAAARARALFSADTAISRQALETAERQAASDAAALALAQRKAVIAWGPNVPWRNARERSALLGRLSSGDAALARVTFPPNAVGDTIPSSFKFERVDATKGSAGWNSGAVWSAPADPTVPGRSFYAIVERARNLLPGERLRVYLSAAKTQQGVVIPSAAVLIAEGKAWYYDDEHISPPIPAAPLEIFTRRMLDMSQPTKEGYFVPDGMAGQVVVIEGAGLLLARETGSSEEEE